MFLSRRHAGPTSQERRSWLLCALRVLLVLLLLFDPNDVFCLMVETAEEQTGETDSEVLVIPVHAERKLPSRQPLTSSEPIGSQQSRVAVVAARVRGDDPPHISRTPPLRC
jgi:hypothetical protein